MRMVRSLLVLVLARRCSAHAVLEDPAPRTGMSPGVGTKLTPFASAAEFANNGCGGTRNLDPGVELPTRAYSPGDDIELTWKMTIPHDLDVITDGVRIAIHYSPTDSFLQNILAGGLRNDPDVGTLPVAEVGADANDLVSHTVTLDATKTCDFCTLQWIWSAENDGGSYLACADISITNNGQLPDFSNIDSEVGNILPGVPQPPGAALPPPPPGGGGGAANAGGAQETGSDGGGSAAGPVIGVIVALAVVGAVAYWYFKVRNKKAGPGAPPPVASATIVPPPPPPSSLGLPPGWTEAKDPATGVNYYYNANTGETQWTKPGYA